MGADEFSGRSPEPMDSDIRQHRETRPVRPEDSGEFRKQYGYLRSYYRLRPKKYRDLQRWLNQARYGTNYDAYLEKSALYSIGAGILGVVFGVLITYVLVENGVIASLENPFSLKGDLTVYLGQNRTLFSGAIIAVVAASGLAAGTWYARYYYPRSIVSTRRQSISVTLPHAITFMYALSYGGMDLLEVIEILGSSQDTYGEVANEFQMIVRDIELFGNDLYQSLQNARNLTPSNQLEQFLDDLLSVLDSGGDVTVFLETQTDAYLEDAHDEQTAFIETLSLLSEVFVVMFVAAPLFLIVILIVMSLLGADTLTQVSLLVYLVLPLAMAAFLVVIDALSAPFAQARVTLDDEKHVTTESVGRLMVLVVRDTIVALAEWIVASSLSLVGADTSLDPSSDEYIERQQTDYLRRRRRRYLLESLDKPFAVFDRNPLLTLLVTIPLAIAAVAFVTTTNDVTLSQQAFLDAPRMTTVWLVVLPVLVVTMPLTVFVERKQRRERSIAKQFPDTMNALSSANKMGVPTTDALGLVAKWSSGPIERELRKVRNDIRWNNDTTRALRSLADRIRVPQLSRAIKLIAEGMRSSSDLARVLGIAAEDTRNRFKIEQQRRRELSSYVAVVIIGYLVYLLVVALLTTSYLAPIAAIPESPTGIDAEVPISVARLPVSAYETLFFHSAIIQGFGSGLLAGKLVDNSALSGLKYGFLLVIISTIAFLII